MVTIHGMLKVQEEERMRSLSHGVQRVIKMEYFWSLDLYCNVHM